MVHVHSSRTCAWCRALVVVAVLVEDVTWVMGDG